LKLASHPVLFAANVTLLCLVSLAITIDNLLTGQISGSFEYCVNRLASCRIHLVSQAVSQDAEASLQQDESHCVRVKTTGILAACLR
jgi:hypothetical protein